MEPAAKPRGVVIDADALYDLPALKAMGWGTAALRTARRKHGLKVRRCGRKSWVKGADIIAVIESQAVVTG
jgi:hypothetical protein